MPRLLSCLVLSLFVTVAWVADTQQKLSPAQQKLRKEAEALRREAKQLARAGKFPEAIDAAKKMLAVERKLHGANHAAVASSLSILAGMQMARGDYTAAAETRDEEARVKGRLFGEADWRAVDTRWEAKDARTLAKLKPEQRARLKQATQRTEKAVKLHQAGKHAEALPEYQGALKLFQ
jgi:tetratricopeptide (TPR) repeat protein